MLALLVANGRWRAPLVAALAATAGACIGPETPEPRAGASSGGAGGSGTASPCLPRPAPATLPFEVPAAGFIPSGFMGDGALDPSSIGMVAGGGACQGTPPVGASTAAICYAITYAPLTVTGAPGWAGLYWQYPVNNWGGCPGRPVTAGATKVTFFAAGAVGGEKVSFKTGGIAPMDAIQAPYVDTFSRTIDVTLTNAWTPFTIDMPGATYTGGVLGAFAWIANAFAGGAPVTFFLDDIVWQR